MHDQPVTSLLILVQSHLSSTGFRMDESADNDAAKVDQGRKDGVAGQGQGQSAAPTFTSMPKGERKAWSKGERRGGAGANSSSGTSSDLDVDFGFLTTTQPVSWS